MNSSTSLISALFAAVFLLAGCSKEHSATPKPKAYPRVELPAKAYKPLGEQCKYTFDIPVYATVTRDPAADAEPCWINVNYADFNATLHISYHDIKGDKKNFTRMTEDSRALVFKHTVKASAIDESTINDPKRHVHGTYYTIDGNAASALQFYLTDSTKHFMRAALYFKAQPKLDSIQPVLDFIKDDIGVMLKTFEWRD